MKFAVFLLLPLLLLGCDASRDFQEKVPPAEWFDSVEPLPLESAEAVSQLWQSKDRCCIDKQALKANQREFNRACYQAILDHYDDEQLVVKCLRLMGGGEPWERRLLIKRYLVANFPKHQKRTDNCHNCAPGNTVVRTARDLAFLESRAGNRKQGIATLIRVLEDRQADTSLWVQTEAYVTLGQLYLEGKVHDAARQRMQAAYTRLEANKHREGASERELAELASVLKRVLAADSPAG